MLAIDGLYTAIVTPFKNGEIDKPTFLRLLDHQRDSEVDGVVVCGSTGEAATLSNEEKVQLWSWAVEHLNGDIPIIAGTGNNDTRSSIELTRMAEACGVQGALVVTPYYNKPTPAGQVAHFTAIANATSMPVVMYNVPARTATNMLAETQLEIAEACKNVVATKEASANLEQMAQIIRNAPSHFQLIAGDDSLALPIIAQGGKGCIAVISNYAPRTFSRLIHAALADDFETARAIHDELVPFYAANFWESNPGPVKYILSLLGMCEATYRLPLVPPTASVQEKLKKLMQGFEDVASHESADAFRG